MRSICSVSSCWSLRLTRPTTLHRAARAPASSVAAYSTATGMAGTVEDYQQHFHTGKILGSHALAALAPCPGLRVLDLGCGDGALTVKIAEAGAEVVGVDADASFVAAARLLGVDARVCDGHLLDFDQEFDVVFSNAALHWMSEDPQGVVQGVQRSPKPGGRFIAEFGGQGNVAMITEALSRELALEGLHNCNPWFFPGADEYATMLRREGFSVDSSVLVPAPTQLPPGSHMHGTR